MRMARTTNRHHSSRSWSLLFSCHSYINSKRDWSTRRRHSISSLPAPRTHSNRKPYRHHTRTRRRTRKSPVPSTCNVAKSHSRTLAAAVLECWPATPSSEFTATPGKTTSHAAVRRAHKHKLVRLPCDSTAITSKKYSLSRLQRSTRPRAACSMGTRHVSI